MEMDWIKLYADVDKWAAEHRDEFVKDISDACRIRSVSVKDFSNPDEPFGKACREMLERCFEMSHRYGFETRNYDNFCGSAVYGDNPDNDSIGIFSHMDIVPEGDLALWTNPPFEPTLSEDGKYLFARGTADNKSCGIMALYAMRYLKEAGIKLKHNVMLVYGMSEEIGMYDMPEFLKREKCPKVSLVPDAKYPVTLAEKGITKATLRSPKMTGNLVDLWSGIAVNAGSPLGWAILSDVKLEDAKKAVEGMEKVSVEEVENGVKITVERDKIERGMSMAGKLTAVARLCKTLAASGLLTGNGQEVFDFLANVSDDYQGKKIGIYTEAGPNGPLRCSFNMMRMEDGCVLFYPDIRYPSLADKEFLLKTMEEYWNNSPMERIAFDHLEPYYYDIDNPFVQKLMECSREALGMPEIQPLIDGGTYARKIPNAFAYGATVPGRVRLWGFSKGGAHSPDEYCDIPNLLLNIRVFVRTLIDLDNMLSEM